jgi:hypothetical protein
MAMMYDFEWAAGTLNYGRGLNEMGVVGIAGSVFSSRKLRYTNSFSARLLNLYISSALLFRMAYRGKRNG